MTDNNRRALEGEAEVLLSADALANDPVTACIDAVANIMHFAYSLGVDADVMLRRSSDTYNGDMEDGLPAEQTRSQSEAFSEEFVPRGEALLLLRDRLNDLLRSTA